MVPGKLLSYFDFKVLFYYTMPNSQNETALP